MTDLARQKARTGRIGVLGVSPTFIESVEQEFVDIQYDQNGVGTSWFNMLYD